MLAKRTDLALEARELWQESAERTTRLSGVKATKTKQEGYPVTRVDILDERGEKALGKPQGSYLTVDLTSFWQRKADFFERAVRAVGSQLKALLPGEGPALVIGLGNEAMTPDAVGPLAADNILITRHLIAAMPKHRRVGRVCATVQLSNTGIIPGSGVGNHRSALNQETLGVPVFAIGIPTVVDAATLAADLLEESGVENIGPEALQGGGGLMVTTQDIDRQVRDLSKVVGYGINWALQDLEIEEMNALLS